MSNRGMSGKQLTDDEVSVLSGRISNPRVPPKSKEEAKAHLKQIEALRKYERQLMEKEAGQQRSKRDNLDFAMKEWEEILPDFDTRRYDLRCGNIWRYYPIPAPYRGNIWKRVLGNPGGVTEEGYRCWLQKAQDRHQSTVAAAAAANPSSPHVVPIDDAIRRLLDDDPNYFSPTSGKDDSANLIAVDLPRTIITRTGSDGHRRVDSTISSSMNSPRGGMSPNRRSMDGLTGSSAEGVENSPRNAQSPAPSRGSRSTSPNPNGSATAGGGGGDPSAHVGTSAVDTASFANNSFSHQQGQSTSFATTTLVEAMGQDNLMSRLETCLRCFVEHRPDMGYVQGMSYLASMLLMNLSDRDAFIALSAILTKGHFPYFYTVNHQGMSAHISVFERVVRAGAPALARNLTIVGVMPQMYVCDWWMSMFSRTLPYEITARCWDLYLYDDAYLYRISFCLLMYFEHVIHEDAALDEVMTFLSKISTQPINEERFFNLVNNDKLGPSLREIRGFMDSTLGMLAPQVGHNNSESSNGGGGNGSSSRSLGSSTGGSSRSMDGVTTNPEP